MAIISIAGNFGTNIGDLMLRDILISEIESRGHKYVPYQYESDLTVLLGGGLGNTEDSITYYTRQMTGKHKAALGIGVNPIFDKNLQNLVHDEMKDYIHISTRDQWSSENLERCRIQSQYYADLVFSIITKPLSKAIENTILIIPVYVSGISTSHQIRFYQNLISQLKDYTVKIISFDKHHDEPLLKYFPYENENIQSEFEKTEYVIAGRYHACILAIMHYCKLLPISYNFKISELMKNIGLSQFEIPMGNGTDGFHYESGIFDVERLKEIPMCTYNIQRNESNAMLRVFWNDIWRVLS